MACEQRRRTRAGRGPNCGGSGTNVLETAILLAEAQPRAQTDRACATNHLPENKKRIGNDRLKLLSPRYSHRQELGKTNHSLFGVPQKPMAAEQGLHNQIVSQVTRALATPTGTSRGLTATLVDRWFHHSLGREQSSGRPASQRSAPLAPYSHCRRFGCRLREQYLFGNPGISTV